MNIKTTIIDIQIETLEEQDKILKNTRKKYFEKMKECKQEERDQFFELAYEYVEVYKTEKGLVETLQELKKQKNKIKIEEKKENGELPF